MNIYHEKTMELLSNPDLEIGSTYPGRHFVAHHEAVAEVSHLEVMPGTELLNGGKGLRGKVVDVPAQDAWDEYEDCLLYHPYTEEELAAQKVDQPPGSDNPIEDRVKALEEGKADQTEVDELAEALNMILTGVTE